MGKGPPLSFTSKSYRFVFGYNHLALKRAKKRYSNPDYVRRQCRLFSETQELGNRSDKVGGPIKGFREWVVDNTKRIIFLLTEGKVLGNLNVQFLACKKHRGNNSDHHR